MSGQFQGGFDELTTHSYNQPTNTSLDEIAERKRQEAVQARQRNIEKLEQASREKNPDAWVNALGLDNDSLTGRAVNTAASAVNSTFQTGAGFVTAPAKWNSGVLGSSTDPGIQNAYARQQQGTASEEDLALLQQQPNPAARHPRFDSYEDKMETLEGNRDFVNAVNKEQEIFSGIVDREHQEEFSADIRDAEEALSTFDKSWKGIKDGEIKANVWDFVKSTAELVLNGSEAIVTNPQAMLELVAEQVPDLAVGAISRPAMVLTNISRGMDSYHEGLRKYAEENNGETPPEDLNRIMLIAGLSQGALDAIGDSAILDSTGMVKRAIKDGRSVLKAGSKAVGKSVGIESATEGAQAKLEGVASLDPATGMDIYEGAVTGAGVAGNLTTGMSTTEGLSASRVKREEKQQQEEVLELDKDQKIAERVTAGDYEGAVADPDLPQDRVAAALAKEARREDLDPEQAASVRRSLAKIEAETNQELDALQVKETPETKEALQLLRDNVKRGQKLREAMKANNAPEAAIKKVDENIEASKKRLKEARDVTPDVRKGSEQRYEMLRRTRDAARSINKSTEATDRQTTAKSQQQATVATDTQQDVNTRKQAASDSVTALMSDRSALSSSEIDNLISNAQDVLEPTQVDYLRSISKTNQARNRASNLKSVNQDILVGSQDGEFRGLSEYQRDIAQARNVGNQDLVNNRIADLEAFNTDHTRKAEAVREAHELANKTRQPHNVWKTNDPSIDGGWMVLPGKGRSDDNALRGNGGLQLGYGPGYRRVVEGVEAEADAIQATLDEVQAGQTATAPVHNETAETAPAEPVQDTGSESQVSEPEAEQATTQPDQETADAEETEAPQQNEDAEPVEATQDTAETETAPTTNEPEPVTESKPTSEGSMETAKRYSSEDLKTNPDKVYVFGDNLTGRGKKGQAIIRDEPNAIGIPTKRKPAMTGDAFFGQDPVEEKQAITKAVNKIIDIKKQGKTVVMPEDGIGTGSANLRGNSPEVADHLQSELERAGLTETVAEPETTNETPQADRAEQPEAAPAREQAVEETDTAEPETSETVNHGYPHIDFKDESGNNLVGLNFKPKPTKELDKSKHPLATTENFISSVLKPAVTPGSENPAVLAPYIDKLDSIDGTTGSNKQITHLNTVANKVDEFSAFIEGDFQYNEKAGARNLVNSLADNGVLPENVRTAIAIGALNYISDVVDRPARMTEDQVKDFVIAYGSNSVVEPEVYEKVSTVTTSERKAQVDIGQQAFKALGLDLKSEGKENYQAQMEAALGAYGLAALMRAGHMERHVTDLKDAKFKGQFMGKKAPVWYVRPTRKSWEGNAPLTDVNQNLLDSGKNTGNVLDNLFSVDTARPDPSFEPIEMTQRKQKRTNQPIAKTQKAVIEAEQKDPWELNTDSVNVLDQLERVMGESFRPMLYRMAGYQDLDNRTTQKTLRAGIEGRNQNAVREVDTLLDFRENPNFITETGDRDYSKPFYIPLSVWSVQRVGMNSNINPLESKVHRPFVNKPAWKHKVPVKGSGADVSNKDKYNLRHFRLAVLEGLGAPVDKQTNKTSLKGYKAAVKEAQPFIDTAVKIQTGQTVSETEALALADFAAGKEGYHTFETLVHLAKQSIAVKSGQTFFESTLSREGDGLTNGPALATIMSGAFGSVQEGQALAARMGFFAKGADVQSAGAWQEDPSNHDLYQRLASAVDDKVQQIMGTLTPGSEIHTKYEGIRGLLGDFRTDSGNVSNAGRKAVKTPITSMAFGASVPRAVQAMGEEMVANYFLSLDKVLNNNETTDQKAKEIIRLTGNINRLLPEGKRVGGMSLKNPQAVLKKAQMLEFALEQRNTIVDTFYNTFGQQIEQSVQEQFDSPLGLDGKPDNSVHSFVQHRNKMNAVAKETFNLYMKVRDHEIAQYLKELDEKGLIRTRTHNGKKTYLESLSRKQMQELDQRLRDIDPVVHTAMSKASQQRHAGINMAKRAKTAANGDPAYASEVRLKNKLPLPGGIRHPSTSTLKAHGEKTTLSEPGVRMFVTNIHALDSAIATDTYSEFPALNVHDAEIVAANIMEATAARMNQATFENLVDYSLPEEILQTAYRVQDSYEARIKEDAPFTPVSGEVQDVFTAGLESAEIAERNKLQLLETIQTVNQYGVEGGEYTLEAKDYERIAERQKTSVVERIAKRRSRGQNENPASIVSQLNARIQNLKAKNPTMPKVTVEEIRKLQEIQKAFVDTGDLEAAVNRAVKHDQVQDYLNKINKAFITKQFPTTDVDALTPNDVSKLVGIASSSRLAPEQVRKDLVRINNAMERQLKKDDLGPLKQLVQETLDDEGRAKDVLDYMNRLQNAEGITAWGVLGKPQQPSDPYLTGILSRNPNMPVRELLNHLDQSPVVEALKKLVDPTLKVRYITSNTPANVAPPTDLTGATGFWDSRNGVETLGIKSPEFVDSRIDSELITHETLHSVLYHTVDAVQKGKLKDKNAVAFVQEMEQVRANVVSWLSKPENAALKAKFLDNSNALDNVNETIAWGMTNKEFQSEVLAQVPMKTNNRSRLSHGLLRFVQAIARFLSRATGKKISHTALTTTLVNTAGLMEVSKRAQVQKADGHLQQNPRQSTRPEDIKDWSYQDVFDSLDTGNLTPIEVERLNSVLEGVVVKVQNQPGPWTHNVDAVSETERFAVSQVTGITPFSSEALGVFPLSDRQIFVLEQAELALQEAMASDTLAYKELSKVFRDAKKNMTSKDFYEGDWSQAHQYEKDEAQEKYDLLFDLQAKEGSDRTDHLSRFAALALTVPEVYNKLQAPVDTVQREGGKIGDRLKGFYDGAMTELANRINKTYSQQPSNERIQNLAYRLADIQGKHKQALARKKIPFNEELEYVARKGQSEGAKRLSKISRSKFLMESKNSKLRAIGETGSVISEDRVGEMVDFLMEYRHKVMEERNGFVAGIVNEMRGSTEKNREFYRHLRQAGQMQRNRQHIKENVQKDVRSRFVEELSDGESAAFTQTVLRTDLDALTHSERYDDVELERLLRDPQYLQREIGKWESTLGGFQHAPDYFVQAKGMGYFMATGIARVPGLHRNVHTLAKSPTQRIDVDVNTAAKVAEVLEPLVSLYALKYNSLADRQMTADVFRRENARGNESGVRYALAFHRHLKEEAKQTLFEGQENLFTKGYTREVYNPYTEIEAQDSLNGKELEAAGWEKLPKTLVNDEADPDKDTTKNLYVRKWGGLQRYVSGAVSMTGTRKKGTGINSGEYVEATGEVHDKNVQENQRIAAQQDDVMRILAKRGRSFDPDKERSNYMVPVRNPDGRPVGYRYMMSEKNKDEILERNNRLDEVMASMASHMYDKSRTDDHNRHVFESLKAFQDKEYLKNPGAFIEISPDSKDEQARETWHMLPPNTKKVIEELYGKEPVRVHADLADKVFGYRKYSLENILDKAGHNQKLNMVEHLMNWLLTRIFKDKAKLRVRQAGNVWTAAVQAVKDNWVIKNFSTLSTNILSNLSILAWNGMNPKKMVETHKTAIQGLLDYTNQEKELMTLERELTLNLAQDRKATEQRVRELRDAMDRNPVKALIDEGLFQTIIDDVDNTEDTYSYKSHLMNKVNGYTSKLPGGVLTAGKWMYMTHDTPLYKLMFKTTAFSDFVARYSMYQHITTRKIDPMDHDSAIQEVEAAFVNYDVPTHRTLQYMNDIGLVFFTKYYLRIQKMLVHFFKGNPAKGMMLAMSELFLGNIATVLDSTPSIGSPFQAGALNLPSSALDILPIRILRGIF